MSFNAQKLVEQGLFPENLPPVYSTGQIWGALPTAPSGYLVNNQTRGHYSIFEASKRGGQRRLFGIPHPLFLRDMGLFFDKHWSHIEGVLSRSSGSASKPQLGVSKYRCVRITSHADLPKIRLSKLSRFKFCLVADVSRFFYSIYTHSIPWALHGKDVAKADFGSFSANIFGNRLDLISRQTQSQQTIGVPVGPDSSKIISEIILSAADGRFEQFYKKAPTYVRHVDDYWIGGETQEECEKHLQNLRAALRFFELDINETKTRIISTKLIFRNDWPSEFSQEIKSAFGPLAKYSKDVDPVATLGKVIDKAVGDDDDGLIRHAIRIIDENKIWASGWSVLEHFLAQCAIQFPHSFDYVARVISWRIRQGKVIDKDLWSHIIVSTLQYSAGLGRDSEAAWALWLAKELGLRVPKAVSDNIIANNSGFVLAYFAHFKHKKLIGDSKFYQKLRRRIEGDPFSGSYWPLTLEMAHLGRADPSWKASHPYLKSLHDAKISIIDWEAGPRVFAGSSNPDDDLDFGGPDHAIEDYAGDYGEEQADVADEQPIPSNPFKPPDLDE